MGSPPYMSPEQMQSSKDADARSDIWSIGAITHELLAGKPPFQADTITALCASILRDPAPPLRQLRPDVPQGLEAVVLRCLEKNPADRFRSVAELARSLADFGSASARASAERISRIIDGGISRSGSVDSSPYAKLSAGEVLASVPSPPLRSAIPGYMLAAAAVLVLGGGIAWKVVHQAVAIHDVVAEVAASQPAPAQPLPSPPAAAIPPVSSTPPPASDRTPISRLTTTSALASAPPAATPQPPPAPPHHAPLAHHTSHRSSPVPPQPAPDADDPYEDTSAPASPTVIARPAPTFAPPAPSPAAPQPSAVAPLDPDQLFEGRK
jgi:serine/threonine protein kinase